MSQVSFTTQYMGFPVKVVAGWDRPLQYYHFTVFDLRPDAEDECIFSCLDIPNVFQTKTLEKWQDRLAMMKIEAPEGFWERVEKKDTGNRVEIFRDGDGVWVTLHD